MRDAKLMIYEGLSRADPSNLEGGRAGVLVDEQLGSEVAERAKADGLVLAMPVEKSGTELFELEYGKHYPEHLTSYGPDFFKVLVRYNPADAADDRKVQMGALPKCRRGPRRRDGDGSSSCSCHRRVSSWRRTRINCTSIGRPAPN